MVTTFSFHAWVLFYLDIVNSELPSAKTHGAEFVSSVKKFFRKSGSRVHGEWKLSVAPPPFHLVCIMSLCIYYIYCKVYKCSACRKK